MILFSIKGVYAIPFLGITPFILDIGLISVIFFMGVINITIFYIIKRLDLLNLLLYLVFFVINYGIFTLIGFKNYLNTNINLLTVSFNYLYLLFFVFIVLTFINLVFKKQYIYISIIFWILLPIPISYNLYDDISDLKNNFDLVITNLNSRVNNTVVIQKPIIVNSIIISGEVIYQYLGKEKSCRISLTYYYNINYKRASIKGKKRDYLILYTGFKDGDNCRYLIKKDLDFKDG